MPANNTYMSTEIIRSIKLLQPSHKMFPLCYASVTHCFRGTMHDMCQQFLNLSRGLHGVTLSYATFKFPFQNDCCIDVF